MDGLAVHNTYIRLLLGDVNTKDMLTASNTSAKSHVMLTDRTIPASPPEMENDAILHMRISEALKATLDQLRKNEADLPTRSEMVRRLIERAAEKLPKEKR